MELFFLIIRSKVTKHERHSVILKKTRLKGKIQDFSQINFTFRPEVVPQFPLDLVQQTRK